MTLFTLRTNFNVYLNLFVLGVVGVVCSGVFSSVQVHAATFQTATYTCAVPLTRTNWDTQVTSGLSDCMLQKFNPAYGTLTQVNLTMQGEIDSEVGMENRDTAPQTITANVSASITFKRPSGSELVVLLPTVTHSEDFPATDGTNDFGGPSGETISGLEADDSKTLQLTDPTDLSTFTSSAPGVVENAALRASATGISNYSASANYSGYVDTFALVNASVNYQYQAHDLGLSSSLPPTINPEQNTTLSLIINNAESTPSTGITTIVLTIPTGTQFVSISNPDWSSNLTGNSLTLTNSNPIPSGQQNVEVVLNYPDSATDFAVIGVITGSLFDYNQNNNSTNTNSTIPPQVLVSPQTTGQVLGVSEVVSTPKAPLLRTGGNNGSLIFIGAISLIAVLGVSVLFLKNSSDDETIETDDLY